MLPIFNSRLDAGLILLATCANSRISTLAYVETALSASSSTISTNFELGKQLNIANFFYYMLFVCRF